MVDNVKKVAEYDLCCGCGTCASVCPTDAIEIAVSKGIYIPKVDEERCNHCGLCVECCPGFSVDFEDLNQRVFGLQPGDKMIGNYLGCYVGYSTDGSLRFNSSSGGIATQLLIFALENHLVDGVLVTRMRKDNPLKPEAFIATTKEELISASGSKYCPVSTNVELKEIIKKNGRFAVVGLPCQIHGVLKAAKVFKVLEKRIVLYIGLLCSHMVSFDGTDLLLEKKGVRKEQVSKISYRGKGWPGSMSIETKDGSSLFLPLVASWNAYWPVFSSFFFTPLRCTMCPDQTAEFADISLGDAWLPELKLEKRGASIVISRTSRGKNLLDDAVSAKAISMASVDIGKVRQSQFTNLKFKKDDLGYRLGFLRSMGRETPVFNPNVKSSRKLASALRAFYIYVNIKASSKKLFCRFLSRVPLPLIRLYYGVYKALCFI
jgi:coenzyme F420 hydrogenase subunit beta